MSDRRTNPKRRDFLKCGATGAAGCLCTGVAEARGRAAEGEMRRGAQRLSVERLAQFEALGHGMFSSYDLQAFYRGAIHGRISEEERRMPARVCAPDRLDVDQWISGARDAGMKYFVLTAKRDPGFCLYPNKHTDYTVANSGHKTDV